MLKGMKGYRLTADDLNFIKKKAEDELIRKLQVVLAYCSMFFLQLKCPLLQGELVETRGLLKKEVNALELAQASRELILTSFNQVRLTD